MSKFRELLTIENTRPYLRHVLMGKRDEGQSWSEVQHKTIGHALKEHLREMRDEGRMQPIHGSAGHRIPFFDTWARARSGDFPKTYPDTYPEQLLEMLTSDIMTSSQGPAQNLSIRGLTNTCETEEDAYEVLVSEYENGNFVAFNVGRNTCQVEDRHYQVLFEDWSPRAVLFMTDTPIEPITPDQGLTAVHLEVDFPSGDLLISDTFEVEEFEELTDIDFETESMTDFGRITRSSRLAAAGVAHVFHTHAASILPMDNGGLNFVQFKDPDDHRYDLTDKPESDVWAVSVIDRETFVDLIQTSRECSRDEALEVVEKASERGVRRTVEPGTHHLYFGTSDRSRLDQYDIEGIDQDGLSEVMVLSPEPLDLTPKPGSKIAADLEDTAPTPKI